MADCALAVMNAGAAMLHVHVRDTAGGHSLDPALYRETLTEIRRKTGDGLVLQITTESVGKYCREEQMQVVRDVVPEAVSLALSELVPTSDEVGDARKFHAWLNEAGIMVQHILYTPEELVRFAKLWRDGVFGPARPFVLLVLGRYIAGQKSSPVDLVPFVSCLPAELMWMVCAFGKHEASAAMLAATLGGHARIGFENNLSRPDNSLATDNSEAIAQVALAAKLIGRHPMRVNDLRDHLALGH